MFSFNFLNEDSYDYYGIICEQKPPIIKPTRNITYYKIPGRSGSLKTDDRTYDDIIIPIQCSFVDNDVPSIADNIIYWLDSGEGKLIFSNQPDKCYIAHVQDTVTIAQELKKFGKFIINFHCKPFKYKVYEEPIIFTTTNFIKQSSPSINPLMAYNYTGNNDLFLNTQNATAQEIKEVQEDDSIMTFTGSVLKTNNTITAYVNMAQQQYVDFYNSGNIPSKPIITFYGNGNLDIFINNQEIKLNNVVDYITIDSVLLDAYKDTVLQNNNMIGDFPVLQPEKNTISWTGTITKIVIQRNACWI